MSQFWTMDLNTPSEKRACMQLVQPSKFFSVTIFRTRFHRQYARVQTWAMLLFLVTLKNFDVCTVTMHGSCMSSSPKEYLSPCSGTVLVSSPDHTPSPRIAKCVTNEQYLRQH